jgi:hypothetical protein
MTLPARSNPPLTRETGRPVSRRTRTFRPNYLSFAGTYQCNLTCPHCCVPIEWPDRLEIAAALRFLEDAYEYGITILGLTGGEPFLYPEFIQAVCGRASRLGFRFDKIMTNGVWFRDLSHLEEILGKLAEAGFTGKLGLSVDKFHGVHTRRLADFCRTARRVFGRDNIVSISYASRAPNQGLGLLDALAGDLEGVVEWSDLLNRYVLVTPELTMTLNWNHLAPVERAEGLGRAPEGPWDGAWFGEDYCEGPGQALVVNPREADRPPGSPTSVCGQSIPERADGHSRGNPGPRSDRPSGRDFQSLLFLLVCSDARFGVQRQRRRRPGRPLDRVPPQLHG